MPCGYSMKNLTYALKYEETNEHNYYLGTFFCGGGAAGGTGCVVLTGWIWILTWAEEGGGSVTVMNPGVISSY